MSRSHPYKWIFYFWLAFQLWRLVTHPTCNITSNCLVQWRKNIQRGGFPPLPPYHTELNLSMIIWYCRCGRELNFVSFPTQLNFLIIVNISYFIIKAWTPRSVVRQNSVLAVTVMSTFHWLKSIHWLKPPMSMFEAGWTRKNKNGWDHWFSSENSS